MKYYNEIFMPVGCINMLPDKLSGKKPVALDNYLLIVPDNVRDRPLMFRLGLDVVSEYQFRCLVQVPLTYCNTNTINFYCMYHSLPVSKRKYCDMELQWAIHLIFNIHTPHIEDSWNSSGEQYNQPDF